MAEPGRKNGEAPGPEAKNGEAATQEILEQVESGPRSPDLPVARIAILLLCIAWFILYGGEQLTSLSLNQGFSMIFFALLKGLWFPILLVLALSQGRGILGEHEEYRIQGFSRPAMGVYWIEISDPLRDFINTLLRLRKKQSP